MSEERCEACRPQMDGRPRPVHHLASGWQKDIKAHHALLSAERERVKRLEAALWAIATDPLQQAHLREEVAKVLAESRSALKGAEP